MHGLNVGAGIVGPVSSHRRWQHRSPDYVYPAARIYLDWIVMVTLVDPEDFTTGPKSINESCLEIA
jgi:hypothetical protein